jgi:two-component system, NtrC family, nitrogen regulation sensor histidine kinase NtrY
MASADNISGYQGLQRVWRSKRLPRMATALPVGLVVVAIFLGSFTYMTLTGLSPFAPSKGVVTALLLANFAIVLVLAGLIGWRVIRLFMERRSGIAGARLHARLVTMFAFISVLPAITVAVFAVVTLDRGLDTWFSERTRGIIDDALQVAEAYLAEHHQVLRQDVLAMANDLNRAAPFLTTNEARAQQLLTTQAALRSLPAAYLVNRKGEVVARATAAVAPSLGIPGPDQFEKADQGLVVLYTENNGDEIRALLRLPALPDTYLYVARFVDSRVLDHMARTQAAVQEYESLEGALSSVQVTFALIYVTIALVILLAAIWLGLWAANRIVSPISRLVRAAERVSEGDLSARVSIGEEADEIETLSLAFNRMTSQIEYQQNELVSTNHQLDERRRFTEAVLAGVSAGVIGLDANGKVSHVNRAAEKFLNITEDERIGHDVSDAAPEFAAIVRTAMQHTNQTANDQLVLERGGHERTLNVRVTSEKAGPDLQGFVLTFDDITELVSAQRNAAWSDVARRIAHEIKNPLTPIQLSAERLKRKYASEVTNDPEVFQQCTDTIIRQVGDIGRMVDEFSSFARMPEAVMKESDLVEVVRQAVFLQRVAQPEIDYTLLLPSTEIVFDGDARLVSQALTNILKNAAEGIEGKVDVEDRQSRIETNVETDGAMITITITDNGRGLPKNDRMRLTEPYMTTRAKGTGLGLAIVKKIMEDHGGTLELADAPRDEGWESGARIVLSFSHTRGSTNEKEQAAGGVEEADGLSLVTSRAEATDGV